ncbi:MAG: hypothetical protein R3B93_28430 [Bacteroidia bacterium]
MKLFFDKTISLTILILWQIQLHATVVKGKIVDRNSCLGVYSILEFKVDGQTIYKNYDTVDGAFTIENIQKGSHTFEILSTSHYPTIIKNVIIDKDTTLLPVFKLHPVIYHRYDDISRRGFRRKKHYFENGLLAAEGKYKFIFYRKYRGLFKTVKHGVWKYYRENGMLKTEVGFIKGELWGIIREFEPGGSMLFERYYDPETRLQKWIYYGKNGEVDAIAIMKDSIQIIQFSDIHDKVCVPFLWRG